MDNVTDQDLPQEGIIENPDGSVDIEDLEDVLPEPEQPFYTNLAESLPDKILNALGGELCDSIERDREARKKRDKQYEDGIRRTGMGDDAPGGAEFEGASDVVHPALAEACVDFAARAIKELFPPQGPVKTAIIGPVPEEQLDRAERKRTYLNWQLTTQMPEYRSELEQLLTQLPLGGSQFQKFWFDERFNRPVSEFVPIDDILLPYSATSFYTAQRATHIQHVTQFEFDQRVRSGLYLDTRAAESASGSLPEQSATAIANDKVEGKEEDSYNEDGLRDLYEVYCWEDIADPLTTEAAPYIITIDVLSETILSIYRNWAEDDADFVKQDWFVEWKFIPWRGAYAIGFPQLIGSLAAAATGALRALLDAAHINNSQTLVKLKGGRLQGQSQELEPTGVTELEGPAGIDDIRKLMMAVPFNPPSPILFQLLGWLTDAAKGVVSTAEGAIANVGDRTPVGTTQAMIEQGSAIYSAIHARLHESQKRALQILCRINKTWLDEEQEVEELGKLIIGKADFVGSLDVIPVSDPAIFSEAQRYAQMQAIAQMQAQDVQDPSIPWNKVAIRRRALKQMRIDNIDEILPLPPKPVTADSLSEDMAAMQGQMIQAVLQQDHMAHIQGHMTFLTSPLVLHNPLVQGQPLMAILNHIQQHIMLLMQQMIQQTAQMMGQQAQATGQQVQPEQLIVAAQAQVQQQLTQQFAPLMQAITQIQPEIQKKIPPPQMPPEIQATIQIAQMDTERKKALDQATMQAKQAEQQASQQLEGAKLQLDQAQQQFEQMIERQRATMEEQNDQLTAQVDLMNNKADNQQKQMTELLKNRDDNDTKMQIEMQKRMDDLNLGIQDIAQKQKEADMSDQVARLKVMLDHINKQALVGQKTEE